MTSLQCTYETCTSGQNGSRWKSPEMAVEAAVQLLGFHIQGVHMGTETKPIEIKQKTKLEKITRPSLSSGCDAGDFTFFKMEWERYKSNSGEKDDGVLRDQLLQCADEDLRKIIHRNLGIRQNQITLEEMMTQLEIPSCRG